ncbi:MAG: hypothetical protein AAGG01_12765, partial [Planctomycetota bacterium]
RPETKTPEVIVLDVPNHIVMMAGRARGAWPVNARAAQWLADRPSPSTCPVPMAREVLTPAFLGEATVALQTPKTVASWRIGDLAHTGEGVVSLELDLTVEGEGVSLLLHSREVSLSVELRPGENHLVLPLIAPRPDALAGRATLKSAGQEGGAGKVPGKVSIQRCRIVTSALRKRPVKGSSLDRHGALLIRTMAAANDRTRQAKITVTTADGEASQSFQFKAVRPGAPIVVTPGKLIGRRLGTVTLEGPPGSSPQNALQIKSIRALSLPVLATDD